MQTKTALKWLGIFIIAYFILLNININHELGYDEARHASQGHFFYDYFRTALDGDTTSIKQFVSDYSQKGYNIGWLGLYDPPVHAISQAIVFLFTGGATPVKARIATELWALLGIILLFFLSKNIFRNNTYALATTIIFYLSPFGFEFSRLSFLTIPIQTCMVGWFYFTFRKHQRFFSLNFKSFKIRISPTIIIGGLFLAAATLMKYQSLIFAVAFVLIYSLYLIYKEYSQSHTKNIDLFLNSGAWSILKNFALQGFIFLILGASWMKLSLLDYGLFERVLFEGAGRGRVYNLQYFTFFFAETGRIFLYFSLFALIPIYSWIKNRKDSFLAKNMDVFLYVVIIYVLATFLISNKQIRYMVHALPLFTIIMTKGIADFSEYIQKKWNFKHTFSILLILIIASYTVHGFSFSKERLEDHGQANIELVDYLISNPNPKFVVNVKAAGAREEAHYYFSPDLFVFNTMQAKSAHNPQQNTQFSQAMYWQQVQGNIPDFVSQMNGIASQIPVHVVLFKFDAPFEPMVDELHPVLINNTYTMTELSYYKIYSKTP